ncbi:MAG: DUF4177 domain-containing protein [Janthinobacterium lividum]
MKRFEYKLLSSENGVFRGLEYEKLTTQLNQLGQLGWELVTTTNIASAGSTTSVLITLKRELPE